MGGDDSPLDSSDLVRVIETSALILTDNCYRRFMRESFVLEIQTKKGFSGDFLLRNEDEFLTKLRTKSVISRKEN